VGGAVDVGPYEIQTPGSAISYLWLWKYGLPSDGSVDAAALNRNGHDTWQEWRAGTVPTNAASVLRVITVTNAAIGLNVVWQGAGSAGYKIDRATNSNLPNAFVTVSCFVGAGAVGVYNDKSATNSSFYLYRIRNEFN